MSSRARSSSSPWGAGPDQTRRSEPLTQRCFRTGDSSTTGAGDGDGDRLAALDATQYLADLIAKFLLRDDRHPPMAAVLLPPRFNGFIYMIAGELTAGSKRLTEGQVGWLDQSDARE